MSSHSEGLSPGLDKGKKVWDKQKVLEAMRKLKGSGNGRLVDASLKERHKDNLKETSC